MRRFWKEVTVEQSAYGLAIRLDGKPVKTPLRAELTVPTKALADAVIAEWMAVAEKIDPVPWFVDQMEKLVAPSI